MRVLFPGRFQPFHNAHLRLLKKILAEGDTTVLVVIGTSVEPGGRNPFPPKEVKKMILAAVKGEGLPADKLTFSFLPNEENDSVWVAHLLKHIPRNAFDAVVSNNPRVVKQLQFAGIPCINTEMFEPEKYSATNVRRLLRMEGNWRELVPKAVVPFLKNFSRKQV